MKKIEIFDTTLRDGEQSPGCSMSKDEKIEMALALEKLGVDVIEVGFAASSKSDFESIKEISKLVKKATITSLARCNKKDIDLAYEAIKGANKKRIHLFIATSDIHIKYKLKKSREEVLNILTESIKYAKKYLDEIEFSLEDATRTDKDFAVTVIEKAIDSGATIINIPDTVGYIVPQEYYNFIKYIYDNVKNINKCKISVHCHNDLGNATANSLIAFPYVNQIECTINGIGERAGNAALEQIVANIDTRKDYYNCYTSIKKQNIYKTSKLLNRIINREIEPTRPIIGANAFKHESGIHQHGVINNKSTYEIINSKEYGIEEDNLVIGIHSGKHAIIEKAKQMNIEIDINNIEKIINDIKKYFESNKKIDDETFKNIILNKK